MLSGKSALGIEHYLGVMAHTDWNIDLRPGTDHNGGRGVFESTALTGSLAVPS